MASPALPLVRASAAEALKAVQSSGGARRVPAGLAWNPVRHRMSRFAFGPTPAAVTANHDAWFDDQLALAAASPGYGALAAVLATYPYLSRLPAATRAALAAEGNEYGWTSMAQLDHATVALQCWSPCQLYETVVDFFANKLNIANYSDGVWANRVSFDRDVVRAHALGTYRDMLQAAMKHPAMLAYLGNDVSTAAAPNENLGRELLELHTVGDTAGYDQSDVVDSARLLTGRTIDYRVSDYAWSQGLHWTGAVQVMGFSDPNTVPAKGEAVADAYVAYLAGHPATAAKLARQLCVRYVSDTPSAALVQAVADAYLANDTAIVPMLRTIYRSTEFWDSRGAKTRRPMENILATVRVLGLQPADGALDAAAGTLSWYGYQTGDRPLSWQPPNGYPDVAAAWRSSGTLLALWGYHLALASNWMPAQFTGTMPATYYGSQNPQTVGAAIDAMATTLLGAVLPASQRSAVLTYLGEADTLALARSTLAWERNNVAALMLHGIAHASR